MSVSVDTLSSFFFNLNLPNRKIVRQIYDEFSLTFFNRHPNRIGFFAVISHDFLSYCASLAPGEIAQIQKIVADAAAA